MSKASKGSLLKLANAAFQKAAVQVIERAKQSGTPVIVWEDGRVKAVPSEDMEPRITRKKNEEVGEHERRNDA